MKSLAPFLWVGLGGFFGANARFLVARVAASLFGVTFPYGTLIINLSGSFLLGIVATLVAQRAAFAAENLRLGVAIGFLGAYTTFSTYELESNMLLVNGRWMLAFLNLFGSLALGLVAVRLGILLAR